MPHVLGFHAWFESKFKDLCDYHDTCYSLKLNRRDADCALAGNIFVRGYPLLALVTYFFVRIFGYWHYYK